MLKGIIFLTTVFLISCGRRVKIYGHAPFDGLLTISVKDGDTVKVKPHGVRDDLGLSILDQTLNIPSRDTVVVAIRLDSGGRILFDTSEIILKGNKEPFIWMGPGLQPRYGWTVVVGDYSLKLKM